MKKEAAQTAWNYCQKLTKIKGHIPPSQETIDALFLMFIEYQHIHAGLYEVGGGVDACMEWSRLESIVGSKKQLRHVIGVMNIQLNETNKKIDRLLSFIEEDSQ